jgi:hypothetical protein
MRRSSYTHVVLSVVALGLMASYHSSSAQQLQFSKSTRAGHEVSLKGYAHFNDKCESRDPPPTIYVDKPREHGVVCFRPAADIVLRWVASNERQSCLGHQMRGIRVFYLPRMAYSGPDKVRYTVHFANVQQVVDVNLTVLPGDQQSQGAAPANSNSPADDLSQMPGPMPMCAALVS